MVETVKNTRKTFLSGVLLLSLSTVLVKIIGLIYKIPMLSYLGSEGMGYFNSAYEIYALFCVIATAGLPVALSVLISGAIARREYAQVACIYRTARSVFLLIGFFGTAAMLLLARRFCLLIRSENAYLSMLSIAPTVFFVCLSSALRGYFQGQQRMLPTAISQIIESVGKLIFGLLLARFALKQGYGSAAVAAFAGLGLTLGTAAATLYLLAVKRRMHTDVETADRRGELLFKKEQAHTVRRELARLAFPVTVGASLVSMTKLIDMAMILRRLQSIGYTEVQANEAYGSYTTLALSVYGLLPSLINAVALPLVPMLSAAIASGDRQRQAEMIRACYRITAIFAVPAALGVSAYARPVLSMLFSGEQEAISVAAPLLSCLGVSVFLSCMITATNSVLHAYQAVNRPILSMLVGAALKILSAYLLIGSPTVAMLGAPISTFLCNLAVVMLNLWFSARLCRVENLQSVFWRPLGASMLSIGASYLLYLAWENYFGASAILTLGSIFIAVTLYLLFSCLFGVVEREDVLALPMGERLYRLMKKLRLLPRI